jgi:hypothetical protein
MTTRRRDPAGPHCLRVMPRPRGGWLVINDQEVVVSEHVTATEAELVARAQLRDGDELLVYDCYHRCHSARRAANRPHVGAPRRPVSPR